ncbi:DUF748 domain-containing protein [Sulfurisoma sediminicola]|uniref:Uncharacterized protein DUF748 n=1 Tax=Sulfurisoma sediminicola TaxID=1381557 RepID=A0A497XDK8_9PROT|nr:DUF748 domain-containing protein [Sulfurisoma sediminicola]RLJ64635.1 uncharacterized protein DUF748 [Sulfurisoma sediminicola]
MSGKRLGVYAAAGLIGLLLLVVVGMMIGARVLKGRVEAALGPESEIGEIALRWNGVAVHDLRLKAPRPEKTGKAAWPTEDTLRAKRILIKPDLPSLLAGRVRIGSIVVEDAFVSALRTADGKLRVVPSLLEKKPDATAAAPAPAIDIGRIELKNGAMAFYDASLSGKKGPFLVRLEQLNAHVTDIALPALTEKSQLHLEGVVKGQRNDGSLLIDGWMRFADKDSDIATRLRNIDLVALQPYLLKAADTGVKRGTLDLDLQSTIKDQRLRAPGSVTLRQLELDERGGSFMGMPRQAAVGMMKDGKGQISVKFVLEGRIDDPKFSLNESLATRFGASMADTLGVSIEGIAKGAGGLSQKGLEAGGGAASGVGQAMKGLFGK